MAERADSPDPSVGAGNTATAGPEQFSHQEGGRVVQRLARMDARLRIALPPAAYQGMVGRVNQVRAAAGYGPGRGRLLPDFVIIGAVKAGTTSLYGWLSRHPFVSPATRKEVHFFDYNHYRRESWYRQHFPFEAERSAFAVEQGRPFLTGEASPSYISHHWVPERLVRLIPEAKLLLTVRNPVDRAYSQFQMSRREGAEPLESFVDAVAAEPKRLAPELARMRRDRHYNSSAVGCWSYLLRSRYAEDLERWMALFPSEQFHVLTVEQMAQDPQGTLDRVHAFLGLPDHQYGDLKPLFTASYDPIPADARSALSDYFRPHNAPV